MSAPGGAGLTPEPGRDDGDRDRPLRLLPPRLVPLSAEQERRAVDALAGLLTGFLERQGADSRPSGDADPDVPARPDDHEAA